MTDVTPLHLLGVAVAGAVISAGALLGIAFAVAWSDLMRSRKEGVPRRQVLRHYPWALRRFVNWRGVAWNLPRIASAASVALVVLTIFVVGLLEVFL